MTLVRRVARPLLASAFLVGGWRNFRHPQAAAGMAAPMVDRFAEPLGLPNDPELLVRANSATMLGAGALFATGRLPRLSAVALAATLVPSTVVGHRFWEEQDKQARSGQQIQFLKNAGLLGGLLLAAVDTEGRPGLAWRANRAAQDARRGVEHGSRRTRSLAKAARREARHAARAARREARLAGVTAHDKLT